MAWVPPKPHLSKPISEDELAVVYAALILADDEIPITEDKIKCILNAAEVHVEPIWPAIFAKALQSVNIRTMITSIGGSAAEGAAAAQPAAAAPPVEEAKKPAVVEEESDSDGDMGLGLFD